MLARVQQRSGAKILLALKGFAQWSLAPLVAKYLAGTCASGVAEARLAREEFGGEVHTYAPAYTDGELRELLTLSDHVVFNSPAQWQRFRRSLSRAQARRRSRVRPARQPRASGRRGRALRSLRAVLAARHAARRNLGRATSTASTACTSTPCASRTCRRSSARSRRSRRSSATSSPRMKWVNFGGGHHITRPDYEVERLVRVLRDFARSGTASRSTSSRARRSRSTPACWSPRCSTCSTTACRSRSSTPRRPATCPTCSRCRTAPAIIDAGEPGAKPHTYRLGGLTCLAGDVIGDYSLRRPLADRRHARVPRHGALHDGQDHHLQRRAPAVDRDLELRERRDPRGARVRLRGFQGAAVLSAPSIRFLDTEVPDAAAGEGALPRPARALRKDRVLRPRHGARARRDPRRLRPARALRRHERSGRRGHLHLARRRLLRQAGERVIDDIASVGKTNPRT